MKVEKVVKFEFNNLEHVLEEHAQSEQVVGFAEMQAALETLKTTYDQEEFHEKITDLEKKYSRLKMFKPIDRLLSLAPNPYVIRIPILTGETPSTDGTYHVQINVMHDERRIFLTDISNQTYVQKAFKDEAELSDIIASAGVPPEKLLAAFAEVKGGSTQYTSQFLMSVEERYSPLVNSVKYVTAPAGAVIGMAGGAVLAGGAAAGSVVIAGVEILIGCVGAVITVVGGIAAGAMAIAHGAYHGSIIGAKAGYKLQDKNSKRK